MTSTSLAELLGERRRQLEAPEAGSQDQHPRRHRDDPIEGESVRLRCYTGDVLRELRIENLLLIERAELRLGEGLNAITGETGAGKTVLAHSLDLLMGGKARPQIVRPGAEEAWVEGVFDLPAGLLDDPELAELAERLPEGAEEIVLGRRVSASGRTSAFVAGRAATAADLKLLGGRLLAFYGQHEHRRLTISSAQMDVLDGFAGAGAAGAARALPRGAPRVPAARAPSWPSCASATARGSATSTSTATSSPRSRRWRRTPPSRRELASRARAPAPRRGPARGGRRRPRRRGRRRRGRRRRRPAPSPRPSRSCRRSPASTPGLDALSRAPRRARGRARRRRRRAARLRRGGRGRPRAAWSRSRSGSTRSTACSASTAAASSRCSPTPSAAASEIERLEGAEERGAEAEAALAEAEARREKLAAELSARPRQGGRRRSRRGSRRSSSSWRCRAPRSRSCSSPTRTASAPAAPSRSS